MGWKVGEEGKKSGENVEEVMTCAIAKACSQSKKIGAGRRKRVMSLNRIESSCASQASVIEAWNRRAYHYCRQVLGFRAYEISMVWFVLNTGLRSRFCMYSSLV